MRALVTGGCGFIGSHIVGQLINLGHSVCVVDNLSTGNMDNLNPGTEFLNLDITTNKIEEAFEFFKPEVVFHEAAQVEVQKSIKDISYDAMVNIMGTIKVLKSCGKHNVRKIVFASTAAVYGNPEYLGIDENHPIRPLSFYGVSKFCAEQYIRVFCNMYGIAYTILRYSNVYGPRQGIKGEGGVVSIFIDKILKGEEPLIYGSGEQTRDFISVEDVAKANLSAIYAGDNEVINISTGNPISVNKLYEEIGKVVGKDIKPPSYTIEREGDILHSYLTNARARAKLNWAPEVKLAEGLKNTMDYYSYHKKHIKHR